MRQAECGVSIVKLEAMQGWRLYLPPEAKPL